MKTIGAHNSTKNNLIRNLSLIYLCFYGFDLIEGKGKSGGGKTVAKSALSGLSKLSVANQGGSHSTSTNRESDEQPSPKMKSVLYNLTRNLLGGYDRTIRPIYNDNDVIDVEVDVIYRQVLDMDEKNQVLTSLVWYRQHWQDVFLRWDPHEFSGIKDVWLSSDSVWMPDIVLQEETGTKDYSPRLPYVKVSHEGHVEYHEPVTFTTSCSMNTMHFPFDVQHCSLTFSSWSHPGSKLTLVPERSSEKMHHDLEYFVNTGEFRMEEINVRQTVANYSEIVVESVLDYVAWPQVVFIVTLRRNSSFYVQSMMFPSMLLTSIALLGFFLPPDSGERVGLQITILLTFMVFLLTVCEMFPASTGPYLGVYYVMCIFLLAVNLLMTVVVLQLYYHPCKPVPQRLKQVMCYIGGVFCLDVSELKEYKSTLDPENDIKFVELSSVLSAYDRSKKFSRKYLNEIGKLCCKKKSQTSISSKSLSDEENDDYHKIRLYSSPPTPHFQRNKALHLPQVEKYKNYRNDTFNRNLHSSARYRINGDGKNKRYKRGVGNYSENDNNKTFHNQEKTCFSVQKLLSNNEQIIKNIQAIQNKVNDAVDLFKYIAGDIRSKNAETEQENEWKSVALIMDRLFLRLYFTVLVICHVAITAVAVVTSYTLTDPYHHVISNPVTNPK